MNSVNFDTQLKPAMDDTALLTRYVETGCQDSFEEIVSRHGGWIYSLSLRAVKDKHLAEDVTQAVFIILAKKAGSIHPDTPLSGWLFKTSRFAVSDAIKRRVRMQRRENRAAELFRQASGGGITLNEDNVSDEVSAALDEAVACLSESDRQAILLRFFEGKSLAEVGDALEISEEAAKKRVARAVEKLKKFFARKGIIASAGVLVMMLHGRCAEAAAWTPTISLAATSAPVAPEIASGALQLMGLAQKRLLGAIFAGGLAAIVAVPLIGIALLRDAEPAAIAKGQNTFNELPQVGATIIQHQTPELPAETKWAELYVGYKGQILWRSDQFKPAAAPNPFYLRNGHKSEKPYAVAVDRNGQYFIKPLHEAILQSPVIRQSQFDYDLGPRNPAARVQTMLSVLDDTPPGTMAGGAPRPNAAAPKVSEILAPAPGEEKHAPGWLELRRNDDEGITVVEMFNTSSFDGGMLDPGFRSIRLQDFNGHYVPEPTSVSLLTLGAAALLSRRRRRS
jgi:RNA polymerase sigma factor (sigma-70 family)